MRGTDLVLCIARFHYVFGLMQHLNGQRYLLQKLIIRTQAVRVCTLQLARLAPFLSLSRPF